MVSGMKIALLLLLTLCPALARAIDFTPRMQDRHRMMGDFHVLFQDGEHKCSYIPPRGWTYYGHKEKLSLEANDGCRSHATIEQVSLEAPAPFDDETVKTLRSEMIKELP